MRILIGLGLYDLYCILVLTFMYSVSKNERRLREQC